MFKRTINQFLLTATLVVSLHFGYFIIKPELLTNSVAYYPLLIDGAILVAAFGILLFSNIATSKLPIPPLISVLGVLGTLTFLVLGIGATSVIVYSAYTGDTLSLNVLEYTLIHLNQLFGPIVAESGYLPLIGTLVLSIIAFVFLHKAHFIDTKRLALSVVLFPPTLLIFSPYASSTPTPPKIFSFFAAKDNSYQPSIELDRRPVPASFQSFYLTLLGWQHGAYKTLESIPPSQHFSPVSFHSQSGNRPNIVLITLESVRAAATSPYNISPKIQDVTPNIARLAHEGLLVENAYTSVPHTSKALVAILCGAFPRKEMEISEAEPDGIAGPCIPDLLSKAGYKTAFFQSALGEFEKRHGLTKNMGFHEIYSQEQLPSKNFEKLSYVGMDDYVMFNPALTWMKAQRKKQQPFFISLLNVVSHHPYSTPTNYLPNLKPKTSYDAYLKSISFTDQFIGELIKEMNNADLMKNTIVIITGDHGEAFGDHGPSFHNGTPHEDGMHVPLIIYSPNLFPTPKTITGLRNHLDILPTILEITGINVQGKLPGISLLQENGHAEIVGSCWYENHCAILYKSSGEKYIYWYGKKPNEYYLLHLDPNESTNQVNRLSIFDEKELVKATFSKLNGYHTLYTQ